MEDYATYDRYKFLLTTNNNLLYDYMELKKSQIQTPEQIINDLHIINFFQFDKYQRGPLWLFENFENPKKFERNLKGK